MENSYHYPSQLINPGNTIRELRRSLGITQEDLAYGICSVPKYSRIEAGKQRPSAEEFQTLMRRLHETELSFDDLYLGDDLIHRSTLLRLEEEARLDHWENVAGIISGYEDFISSMTPEKMQIISFFELMLSYYLDEYFSGAVLCETALSILRNSRPTFCWDTRQLDFFPTRTEFLLLNAAACGMIESGKEALYTRARGLLCELIFLLKSKDLLLYRGNAELCMLINLASAEIAHGDLTVARHHLDMIHSRFSCSGGFYLYCKALRCEYFYYKQCSYSDRCEQTLSMIEHFLALTPGSTDLTTFMKNSQKIMVF